MSTVALIPEHQPRAPQAGARLAQALRRFAPIGLAELDRVALQDRTDSKFLVPAAALEPIMAALADRATILELDRQRLHPYRTLYFDTADYALYRSHHAGARNRFKVRSRWYAGTGQSFVEIKRKTNTGRTIKHRMPTPSFATQLSTESSAFVHAKLPAGTQPLTPVLFNEFQRITLVHQHERLTIDLDLCFRFGGWMQALPGVAVVELKQAHYSATSELMRVLRDRHIRPTRFSKYCVGVSLLHPELKHNNFKPLHRLLQGLMQGDLYDAR